MGPTWVMSAQDGPHVGPMNLAIKVVAMKIQIWQHFRIAKETILYIDQFSIADTRVISNKVLFFSDYIQSVVYEYEL